MKINPTVRPALKGAEEVLPNGRRLMLHLDRGSVESSAPARGRARVCREASGKDRGLDDARIAVGVRRTVPLAVRALDPNGAG